MTQGRLYKSARATGPMADEAILAFPERDQSKLEEPTPHATSSAAVAESATVAAEPHTPPTSPVESPRPSVTDFDHIFAEEDLTLAEDEELFPWAIGGDASPASSAAPQASAARTFAPPQQIKVERPSGLAEGRNNPVVTFSSRQPKIRLTFTGSVAVVMGVTLLCGLLEAFVSDHIGLFTAVLSVAAGLATTWFVSESDRTAPSLAFPVAWLVTALIAGQLTAPPSGSLALKQVVVVLGVLGDNALVIILGTLACYALARMRPRLLTNQLA